MSYKTLREISHIKIFYSSINIMFESVIAVVI